MVVKSDKARMVDATTLYKYTSIDRVALKRGGANNRAGRQSELVTRRQAEGVLMAAEKASAEAMPFNAFVTINFKVLEIRDRDAVAAIGQYIKLNADWMASRGYRLKWVWVRENPPGKGSHVHILLHIPPELAKDRTKLQYGWIKAIRKRFVSDGNKGRPPKGAIKTERVGGRKDCYRNSPAHYTENLHTVLSYILKGAAPDTINTLGLAVSHVPQGTVTGKRVGWWQGQKQVKN